MPWIEIEDEYTDYFCMNKTIYFHNFRRNLSYMSALDIDSELLATDQLLGIGLVNLGVLEQPQQGGRRGDSRGLKIGSAALPQPPAIQHVARFSAGISTRQMDKLLESIKNELVTGQ